MPRAHTHYDNLKVSRDAPIEVIRAAYKSLAAKYHPDLHPDSPRTARIMRIINASYGVLSDPVKRRIHDAQIAEQENEPRNERTPQSRGPDLRPPRPAATRPPQFHTFPSQSWPKDLKVIVGIFVAVVCYCVFGFVYASLHQATAPMVSAQEITPPAPTPVESRPPTEFSARELRPVPDANPRVQHVEPAGPIYVRPAYDENGNPWPVRSGYIIDSVLADASGNSAVVVDNRQNTSDMLVKLFDRNHAHAFPARIFFLRAGDRFEIKNVEQGKYDIRYQDLDSGTIWKIDPFVLVEWSEDIPQQDGGILHRTHANESELTLYEVPNGNIRPVVIPPAEFQ